MNKYIRILAVIFTMTLLFAFAGCGSDTVDEPTTQSSTTVSESVDPGTPADIGEAKAKEIVLQKVDGATEADIFEFEKEFEDGILEYEGEIHFNGYEYDFALNGETGQLLEWEIEKD